MAAWLRLAPLFRPYLGWIALSLLASVVAALAGAGLMAVSGGFIASMAVAGAAGAEINYYTPSALVRLFAILRTGSRYGERVIGHEATLRIVAEARGWLFAKLAPLAPGALADLHSGEALARLKTDIDRLETAFLRLAAPLATAAVATLAIAAFIARYEMRLAGLFAALALTGGVAAPLAFTGRLKQAQVEAARLQGVRRVALVDALDGLADLVAADAYGGRAAEAERQFAAQLACEAREQGALAWTQSLIALAADFGVIGAAGLGVLALSAGRLAAPDVTMLTLLVASGFEPLIALPAAFAAWPAVSVSVRRILDLADRKPLAADPADPAPDAGGYAIAFDSVAYAYPSAPAPALAGVCLRIAEGERVAVVGASGAGKTTLIDLMLRVRDPQSGAVSIGGVPARNLRLADLRRRFAVAPQFPHLFDRSLADNLRLANPQASAAEMREALDLVGLTPLVAELPGGLDADLGPRGAKISVGQARRVAIARAWLAKRPVMVLDEPTEGLDAVAGRRLMDRLLAASEARTLIAVTHQADAGALFDRVVTVEGSEVHEAR
jgi:ATP-binding cassette subfamily C protein CydC